MPRVDEVFEDRLHAAIYDDFNPWTPSDQFYLRRALAAGGPVLDLGCGTGMLACRIAAAGLPVVGADPATGMIQVARTRPGAERVDWVQDFAQNLSLPHRFSFIYMTGHAFQASLTDEDAVAVLGAAARHLSVDGAFVFETRNPARRAWASWTEAGSKVTARHSEYGRIEEFHEAVFDARTGIVALTRTCRLLDRGGEHVGRSRLRFISSNHLADLIARAGLEPVAWYGDWGEGPMRPTSDEIIVVTRRRS